VATWTLRNGFNVEFVVGRAFAVVGFDGRSRCPGIAERDHVAGVERDEVDRVVGSRVPALVCLGDLSLLVATLPERMRANIIHHSNGRSLKAILPCPITGPEVGNEDFQDRLLGLALCQDICIRMAMSST
jgi:hypothetical protein